MDIFDIAKFKEQVFKEAFGDDFSEEKALEVIGVQDMTTEVELYEGVPETPKDTIVLLMKAAELHYQNHGQEVAAVREKIARELFGQPEGIEEKAGGVAKASIIGSFCVESVTQDEFGNTSLRVSVAPETIGGIIGQSDATVVNMSFQVGELQTIFHLYDLVRKHPEINPRDVPLKQSRPVVGSDGAKVFIMRIQKPERKCLKRRLRP
ncbi:hypothetical protein COS81_01215 [candidate division WWE3 bacterium CG06_land_8_20_14_3_00_42_16]|uniref:Uncharacterized protein n=4 Tax=Katanobacteria TaxID=422282 RepID=A0A2M7AP54_UNCKA|nr:MAG: hypothetical protein AUJ38_02860 [bacterium CG1_02_42_9]PIU69145.1 MAG: hypothetical protein COS81_01215 [candidate division WWE3 bacterium CG06_land_8_20_14_3_00_42_16]PJA38250.1 MAG: hypothetical protein CO181_00835 [candidate division WWE3 bacterium CG_4_9_14_3_um_filter_43_9]PJC68754.1 MAG: hypothetical protein CO015_02900 [candidate division WWE3 bacterium CG_4_8_14_3_um_filter_42_11]